MTDTYSIIKFEEHLDQYDNTSEDINIATQEILSIM